MDKKTFWALIEESGKYDEQAEWLIEQLSQKSLEEALEFEFIMQSFMNESYQSRLWGAAYVLMGGCSDDTFDYFRGWLIGQGEEVYHKVINDPEYLAEYIDEDNLDDEGYPQNEDLISVGSDAYTFIKTGDTEWDDESFDELLDKLREKGLNLEPDIELDWEEEDLEGMFPALWERFGEEPLG
ncbi:molybdenum metabolism regulator [Bhargavaea cecembensis]|uniref:Molybdenum metabolism regulator n=1 Tax=Bhargavaea cecembensis TaxID=394098 RepID=A0A161SNC5_9BACL|nr:DUF4240 domain-containing protein [Bhargavaea cecembensis]KZE36390.1 molybdenum metabolism regulator [Bhargavaea cecembensis]